MASLEYHPLPNLFLLPRQDLVRYDEADEVVGSCMGHDLCRTPLGTYYQGDDALTTFAIYINPAPAHLTPMPLMLNCGHQCPARQPYIQFFAEGGPDPEDRDMTCCFACAEAVRENSDGWPCFQAVGQRCRCVDCLDCLDCLDGPQDCRRTPPAEVGGL